MKKKQKKWIRFRHRVVRNIAAVLVGPVVRILFRVKVEPVREKTPRQYLIVLNHQTVGDQFFVGMAFRQPIYYLATEDIFSKGWISALLRFALAPIPIKKQTTDLKAVKTCIRVAREGGTIAIAPEGNRTYSGKTEYMNTSIVTLAKALKLPIALFRIEGGYGVQPRWSDVIRKGPMRAFVSRVIEPEEYRTLSDQELFSQIWEGLFVDDTTVGGTYHHKKLAEYLERAIYVCPECGLSEFESHDDIIECKTCRRQIQYLPSKELKGIDFTFPFRYVTEWYDYQCNFVSALDLTQYLEQPMFEDNACLSEVIVYKNKNVLREDARIALYGDRITIDDMVYPFDDISAVSVLGRNKLNIYYGDNIYQLKGSKRFNALKYVNIFYLYKNITKENVCGTFLGL